MRRPKIYIGTLMSLVAVFGGAFALGRWLAEADDPSARMVRQPPMPKAVRIRSARPSLSTKADSPARNAGLARSSPPKVAD